MIAVLGATGFTGQRITRALREANPDAPTTSVVRPASDRQRLRGLGIEFRFTALAAAGAVGVARGSA